MLADVPLAKVKCTFPPIISVFCPLAPLPICSKPPVRIVTSGVSPNRTVPDIELKYCQSRASGLNEVETGAVVGGLGVPRADQRPGTSGDGGRSAGHWARKIGLP